MKILITAGPTREKIDPVRYISNNSSGKMGYAIAQAACESGHEVTLISGPVSITPPPGVKVIKVVSAADMANAVHSNTFDADVIIMAAAVADYRPARPLDSKMKKLPGNLFLELERTEDILGTVGNNKKSGQLLVGFAAETDDLIKNAQGKLERKNLDFICANIVGVPGRGFASDTNAVTLIGRNNTQQEFALQSKTQLAEALLDAILQ